MFSRATIYQLNRRVEIKFNFTILLKTTRQKKKSKGYFALENIEKPMIYVMSMNNQVPRIQYDAASSNRRFEEQRITPNIDATVNPSDVLCGRGKSSFTHGKLLFAHNSIAVEAEAAAGCCFAAAVQLHTSYNTGLRCCCSENSDYQSSTHYSLTFLIHDMQSETLDSGMPLPPPLMNTMNQNLGLPNRGLSKELLRGSKVKEGAF